MKIGISMYSIGDRPALSDAILLVEDSVNEALCKSSFVTNVEDFYIGIFCYPESHKFKIQKPNAFVNKKLKIQGSTLDLSHSAVGDITLDYEECKNKSVLQCRNLLIEQICDLSKQVEEVVLKKNLPIVFESKEFCRLVSQVFA